MRLLTSILSNAIVFAAVALGAVFLAPRAAAADTPEDSFELLATHFELDGSLADYPFIYWLNGDGRVCLKVFPEGTTNCVIERQGGTSDDYFYARPVPTPSGSNAVYTVFFLGDNLYYSNDWTAVNIDFTGTTAAKFYGSFDSSNMTFPSAIRPEGRVFLYEQAAVKPSVTGLSNAKLLAAIYDITFTPTLAVPDPENNYPLLNKPLKVIPVAVRDDSGYNLISLQVPQLPSNMQFLGEYHFVPRVSDGSRYFNGVSFSLGSDYFEDDSPLLITADKIRCSVNGSWLNQKSLTVNGLSFMYNRSVDHFRNRQLAIFDYASDEDNIYPTVRFFGLGSIDPLAGSFFYNADFSGFTSDKTVPELEVEGETVIDDIGGVLGYTPTSVTYPDPSEGFDFDDPEVPDFSALGTIFSFMFNNRIIKAMLEMCLVVGLAGYVMYGKKGD